MVALTEAGMMKVTFKEKKIVAVTVKVTVDPRQIQSLPVTWAVTEMDIG